MKNRNTNLTLLAVFFLLATTPLIVNGDDLWRTDFAAAQEDATNSKKYVLLNFTGSDWCRYCVHMEKTVFSTDEFGEYAAQNLECVYLDFPSDKELPEDVVEQNKMLQEKYDVKGFPTYILLDSSGEEVYRTSGASSWTWLFIERIDEVIHPNDYTNSPELHWLENKELSTDVSGLSDKSDRYSLHFLDSSSYSSAPRSLKSDVFATHRFRRYAAANLNLVLTPMSAMFPPMTRMSEEELESFKGYVNKRGENKDDPAKSRTFDDFQSEELARWCYSTEEFDLRAGWELDRDSLPGLVLHRPDGSVMKVLNDTDINQVIEDSGAISLIQHIQRLIKEDLASK